jgi:hypothetical protein
VNPRRDHEGEPATPLKHKKHPSLVSARGAVSTSTRAPSESPSATALAKALTRGPGSKPSVITSPPSTPNPSSNHQHHVKT